MSLLTLTDLHKSFGRQDVLQGVSFFLAPGRKAGLVGPNGAGKTTLLRIILGEEAPDSGQVTRLPGCRMALLAQEPLVGDARTVLEAAERPSLELQQLWNTLVELEAGALEDEASLARYDEARHRFEALGGYECRHRAREILAGLGFPESTWERPVAVLSGGERTRLALVQILTLQPDLLLLDEPTNHVDWEAAEWLQEYLRRYPGAALIVSHDRYFLDEVAEEIIELEDGRARVYSGNYRAYRAKKAAERAQAEERYRRLQEEIARQEAVVQRLRSHRKFDSMHSRERALERLKEQLPERPREERRAPQIRPAAAPASGREALLLRDLEQGFGERTLFRGLSLTLERGERLAIVGPNGVGKTTLLKTIAGELSPRRGSVTWGFRTRPAYFAQDLSILDPTATVWETIWETGALDLTRAIQALHQFLFMGEAIHKSVADLSGGERTRLALCRLLVGRPNLLLLDEPTNHLDVASRDAVEQALCEFPGAVVVVSHDRYFLDSVATRVLELTPEGHRIVDGGFRRYLELRRSATLGRPAPAPARKTASAPAPRARTPSPSRRLPRLEAEIARSEERLRELAAALADAATWAGGDAGALAAEYEELNARLEALYEEWAEVAEQAQQAAERR